MRISNDDLQIIIRGKGPSGADENFILISQSYTFRRGVRTTKEIHTSYSYLIMLIPETINVACLVLAHYRSCMLGQGLDLVQDLHLGPHKLVCLVTVTSVSISSQVNLTNSRLFHVLKKINLGSKRKFESSKTQHAGKKRIPSLSPVKEGQGSPQSRSSSRGSDNQSNSLGINVFTNSRLIYVFNINFKMRMKTTRPSQRRALITSSPETLVLINWFRQERRRSRRDRVGPTAKVR